MLFRSLVLLLPKLDFVCFPRTWWRLLSVPDGRLFQKSVVCTKFDIYVLIFISPIKDIWWPYPSFFSLKRQRNIELESWVQQYHMGAMTKMICNLSSLERHQMSTHSHCIHVPSMSGIFFRLEWQKTPSSRHSRLHYPTITGAVFQRQ
jgi:hypothetical protein